VIAPKSPPEQFSRQGENPMGLAKDPHRGIGKLFRTHVRPMNAEEPVVIRQRIS
jgi:hypothetical protein